ncbi:lactonase family protein [Microbacterium sp. RD1]|uniref:lactonase family protein n=1 Tax=Microbacterium sp. RD1 TaxID=3457313 RepID=UPI003FA526E2
MTNVIGRVFVGGYPSGPTRTEVPGAIHTLDLRDDGTLAITGVAGEGMEATAVALSADGTRLYSVDERRNDGRGPVGRPAKLFAFAVDAADGSLSELSQQRTFAAFPTYVSVDPLGEFVVTASHGSFEHVEHVVEVDGGWVVENLYDDSAICLFPITADGGTEAPCDVYVMRNHSVDPGPSPQAKGHAQASSHAHSALFDPSGQYVLVGDKGADEIHVLRLDREARRLRPTQVLHTPPVTAPRHPAFHPDGRFVFMTDELASGVSTYEFDPAAGMLRHLSSTKSTSPDFAGRNEPADIAVHPNGGFVFVNNRGEDSVVSFSVDASSGELTFVDAVPVSPTKDPGFAARTVHFAASGRYLLVGDRPADRVLIIDVDPETGRLSIVGEATVPGAAAIASVVVGA